MEELNNKFKEVIMRLADLNSQIEYYQEALKPYSIYKIKYIYESEDLCKEKIKALSAEFTEELYNLEKLNQLMSIIKINPKFDIDRNDKLDTTTV